MGNNVVDLPICIDACGNDMYIHIMVREEQLDVAKRIKQDVLDGFSKQGIALFSILEHMVNGAHKISAITLMGTSPEVLLFKPV